MRCRLSLLILLICSPLQAAEPLWLREPALSPDGKQLAFTWQGRVYLSAGDGGLAMPQPLGGLGKGVAPPLDFIDECRRRRPGPQDVLDPGLEQVGEFA